MPHCFWNQNNWCKLFSETDLSKLLKYVWPVLGIPDHKKSQLINYSFKLSLFWKKYLRSNAGIAVQNSNWLFNDKIDLFVFISSKIACMYLATSGVIPQKSSSLRNSIVSIVALMALILMHFANFWANFWQLAISALPKTTVPSRFQSWLYFFLQIPMHGYQPRLWFISIRMWSPCLSSWLLAVANCSWFVDILSIANCRSLHDRRASGAQPQWSAAEASFLSVDLEAGSFNIYQYLDPHIRYYFPAFYLYTKYQLFATEEFFQQQLEEW